MKLCSIAPSPKKAGLPYGMMASFWREHAWHAVSIDTVRKGHKLGPRAYACLPVARDHRRVSHLFLSLGYLVTRGHITSQYLELVGHVLTLFVLVELSRSLVHYFTVHRLRMTYIVDAALVFVLRDVMIALFEKTLPTSSIYALSVLIFVLGALRIASVLVFQRESKGLRPHRASGRRLSPSDADARRAHARLAAADEFRLPDTRPAAS